MLRTPFQLLWSRLPSNKGVAVVCRRCLATISPPDPPSIPLIQQAVRTRFAPSPTGELHLGSLRTALYNFLLAKHSDGQFILRIEDTDKNRTIDGAVEDMCTLLKWAGIDWDEGPGIGGPHGPYQQSERLHIYKGLLDCLIDSKRAYRCFCDPERLDSVRTQAQRYHQQGSYDRHCYHISPEESKARACNNELHVAPPEWPIVNDYLRGNIHFSPVEDSAPKQFFDDIILLKSDGWPTYHLACVIDDHLMEISHVIRGEEWLPSTPKHLVLYEAFGWKPPVFVHLPLLHAMSGRKLSKRDGQGDRSFLVKTFKADGILPEALVNYVALFGWSARAESDVHSMDELIERVVLGMTAANKQFSLAGLTKGGLRVTAAKLPFLNRQHILRHLSTPEGINKLVDYALPFLEDRLPHSDTPSREYLSTILKLSQERMHTLKDIFEAGPYFYIEPDYSSPTLVNARNQRGSWLIDKALINANVAFNEVQDWNAQSLVRAINVIAKSVHLQRKDIMQILRYAVTGMEPGVGVPVILEILGKERVRQRIENCLSYHQSQRTE